MKIKSLAIVIVTSAMLAAVGTLQASCFKHQPGWHMVSKKCPIKHAENWQAYSSGVYTQPMAKKLF